MVSCLYSCPKYLCHRHQRAIFERYYRLSIPPNNPTCTALTSHLSESILERSSLPHGQPGWCDTLTKIGHSLWPPCTCICLLILPYPTLNHLSGPLPALSLNRTTGPTVKLSVSVCLGCLIVCPTRLQNENVSVCVCVRERERVSGAGNLHPLITLLTIVGTYLALFYFLRSLVCFFFLSHGHSLMQLLRIIHFW